MTRQFMKYFLCILFQPYFLAPEPLVFLGASASSDAFCVVSILVENQYYSGLFAGIILPTTRQDAS